MVLWLSRNRQPYKPSKLYFWEGRASIVYWNDDGGGSDHYEGGEARVLCVFDFVGLKTLCCQTYCGECWNLYG